MQKKCLKNEKLALVLVQDGAKEGKTTVHLFVHVDTFGLSRGCQAPKPCFCLLPLKVSIAAASTPGGSS